MAAAGAAGATVAAAGTRAARGAGAGAGEGAGAAVGTGAAGTGAATAPPSTTRAMRSPPTVSWSPALMGLRETLRPLTNVPSALPMSMTEMAPSAATSITAWMRETRSSSSGRCAVASRPI